MTEKRNTTLTTIATEVVIATRATSGSLLTVGTRLRIISVANKTIKVTQSHDQSSANLWSKIAVKRRPTANSCNAALRDAINTDFWICNLSKRERIVLRQQVIMKGWTLTNWYRQFVGHIMSWFFLQPRKRSPVTLSSINEIGMASHETSSIGC